MTQRISPCSSLASSTASPPPGSPCSTLPAGAPGNMGTRDCAYGSITSPTSTLESRDSGIIGQRHSVACFRNSNHHVHHIQKWPTRKSFKSRIAFLQQRSRVTRRMPSTEENTARAHGAAWNSGRHRSRWVQTPFFIGWMKTWPPPHTASTKSQKGALNIPSLTPPTPSPSTSCPAPILWLVSFHTCNFFIYGYSMFKIL